MVLETFHLYPKTPRDLTVSTRLGGGLSLVALCVMGLLFLTEFQQYMSSRLETTLELDDNEEEKLLISFNLSLPRLPCQVASVDVRDVLGTRYDDTRSVFKHKLDAAGRVGALVGGTVSFAPGGQKLARENYVPGPRQPTNQGRKLAAMAMVEDDGPAVNTGSVDDLSPEDFEAALGSYDLVMVNFYAPWCPHCIQLDPVWRQAKAVVEAKKYADDVLMAKVNCNDHKAFCQDGHSVDRFPTIRAYANRGEDMEVYSRDLDAHSFVDFVDHVMATRDDQRSADDGTGALTFKVGESVQVWWHNAWRDASVTRKLSGKGADDGFDYAVRFSKADGFEEQAGVQVLEFMGALIRLASSDDDGTDNEEHEVSAHVLRVKPNHPDEYKKGEDVQIRLREGWQDGAEVVATRPVADAAGSNCTAWAAHGDCATNAKYMLAQCKRSCNASGGHALEYQVLHHAHRLWVPHDRLLPHHVDLRIHAHATDGPVEGCRLSGQVLVNRVPGVLAVRVASKRFSFNDKAANASHIVHHLSFGHVFALGRGQRVAADVNELEARLREVATPSCTAPGSSPRSGCSDVELPAKVRRAHAPLDGRRFSSSASHVAHAHFLKVVRTSFAFLSGRHVDVYHFTASSSTHKADAKGPPSVEFTYDLAPMQVVITEESEGLFRFVVFCFAIVGGGFTAFGLLDAILFHGDRLLRQKVGLGKAA